MSLSYIICHCHISYVTAICHMSLSLTYVTAICHSHCHMSLSLSYVTVTVLCHCHCLCHYHMSLLLPYFTAICHCHCHCQCHMTFWSGEQGEEGSASKMQVRGLRRPECQSVSRRWRRSMVGRSDVMEQVMRWGVTRRAGGYSAVGRHRGSVSHGITGFK